METKDQAHSDLEPSSQQSSLEVARELVKQGVLPLGEIAGKTGLSEMVVRGLKGAQARAEKKLLEAQADSKPTEAVSEPQIPIQALDKLKVKATIDDNEHEEEEDAPTLIPQNYVFRPGATAEEFQKYMKMKKEDLISENINLKAQNSSLQNVAQTRRGNGEGHSSTYGENYIDALGRLVDKIGMQKQAEKMVEKMFPSEKNDDLERKFERLEDKIEKLGSPKEGNMEKTLDVLGKIYDRASSSQSQGNPYQVAQSILSLTKEQANLARGTTNEYDLKKEEMRQLGDLEVQKLSWEIEKYRDQKQSSADTINAIKDIFKEVSAGPIGKFIGNAGEGMKNRIEGGARLPSVDVLCPNCGNKFKANPTLDVVTCNGCGASLRKQPPTGQSQPLQQPQPEATQQQPQEPKQKPIDVTADDPKQEQKLSEKPETEVI